MYRNIIFQAILAALLAVGCEDGKGGPPDGEPGAIAGTVMKPIGDPVADARVYIRDDVSRLTTSKGDGTYELLDLPAGDYTVVAVSPEGLSALAGVTVVAGQTTSLDLVLASGGSLAGVVKLEGEQDHSGALVYFPGYSFAAHTDWDGSFLIDSIIPGCHTVRAEHRGFYPEELERVCIRKWEQTTLPEITLLKHTLPDCMDDDECGPHQVCENRICSYVAGYSVEICDGKDNDGDGYVDEGVSQPCGPSQGVCDPGFSLCLGGEMSECRSSVLPRDERCDQRDDDCDGLTDEDFDTDGDNYTSCDGDCDDSDAAINPEATEVCDMKDNNCDGRLDEGCPSDCADQLTVTVIAAADRQPLAGAHVTVVDDAGATHTADTDAAGIATFSSLATGPRRSITAKSDETVPPLPGPGGPDRPRYETTTVLGPCTDGITIPLRLTASGSSTPPMGTVVGKVPASLFNLLPHSWKCAGDCDSDHDCDETYYCEMDETTPCGPKPPKIQQGTCTPRTLLPFYAMGDPYISGQMRVAMLVPVLPQASFTYRDSNKVFAPPPSDDAIPPGNVTTDDSFLNGLAPSLGLEPWGDTCVRTSDCPNSSDYVCEQDPQGDYRCKDKNPLRNIRMRVPAGSTRLVVILGVMDADLMELVPVLLPFLTSDSEVEFDYGSFLAAFKLHTLHVCPITVDVTADTENDITPQLGGIILDSCWSVDYDQVDSTVARTDLTAQSVDSCENDGDCCDDNGHCGWPESGRMCLEDPGGSGIKGCFSPLFRIEVVTDDEIRALPPATGFDPTRAKADTRLCSLVPASAPFEVLCPTPTPNIYDRCDPRDIRDLDVPPDHECSFPYGVALAMLDFPVGHPRLPEGGRVFIGYDFNRSPPHHHPEPEFLVPFELLDGSVELSVTQMFFRYLAKMADGNIRPMPGVLATRVSTHHPVASLQLPPLANIPALQPPPEDAGFDVKIVFEAEDPSVFPPVLERVYAVAKEALLPQAGVHELTYDLTATTLEGEDLVGVVLSRVDYQDTETWVDPWWRVYARPGTTSISLPPEASPFESGQNVRVTPFGSDLEEAFNYDLFPVDAVLGPRRGHVEDSWAVIVP
jgi:hypothetical protein